MGDLLLFGYGSLMYEPELPDRLIARIPCRLPGHRRAFNKRSLARGAPSELVERPPLPGFVEGGLRVSLCLGTEPGDGLDGMVLRYPAEVAELLLPRMHAREGWSADRPDRDNAYHPREVTVETASGALRALGWFTNPASRWYTRLSLEEQARVLVHATPVRSPDGRARGAAYLHGVQRALRAVGIRDPYVDDLVRAVDAIAGRRADRRR